MKEGLICSLGELGQLPAPRRPRTKGPSVEVILRLGSGNDVSFIGPLTPSAIDRAIEYLNACRPIT